VVLQLSIESLTSTESSLISLTLSFDALMNCSERSLPFSLALSMVYLRSFVCVLISSRISLPDFGAFNNATEALATPPTKKPNNNDLFLDILALLSTHSYILLSSLYFLDSNPKSEKTAQCTKKLK